MNDCFQNVISIIMQMEGKPGLKIIFSFSFGQFKMEDFENSFVWYT